MRPNVMIFIFSMLSFKPAFTISSFTFIKRLFNSASLSAMRMVSFAYLRSLIFLLGNLILTWASSSLAVFHMMHSTYKLNKQGGNIQPWHAPYPICNQSVVTYPVLTIASWPAYRRQVKWSGIPIFLRIFHIFFLIHTIKAKLWKYTQWNRGKCFFGITLGFIWSNGCWQFDLCFLCLF